MKFMIQLKVEHSEAEKYISGLEAQGYAAHRVARAHGTDVHFVKDGETSADYSVTMYAPDYDDCSYVGIRPA